MFLFSVFNPPLSLRSQKSNPSPLKTTPVKSKQTKKKQKIAAKSPAKNNGDIRSLFCTASTKNYTKLVNDMGIPTDGSVPTRIINLLVDLNVDNSNTKISCYLCENICDCKLFKKTCESREAVLLKFVQQPIYPNLDLIDDITSDAINKSMKGIESQSFPECDDRINQSTEKVNCTNNFDLDFDFDALDEIDSPKRTIETETVQSSENNFDLGNIEDIFASSSPEEVIEKDIQDEPKIKDTEQPKEALEFFGLDSIEDIFADSDDSVVETPLTKTPEPKTPKNNELEKNNNLILITDDEDTKTTTFIADTTNKSMFTVTQLVDMINTNDKSVIKDSSVNKSEDRSASPILLSQTYRKKTIANLSNSKNTSIKKAESLIILDSDSESDDTQIYELDNLEFSQIDTNVKKKESNEINLNVTNKDNNKRKFDDTEPPINDSPYFNKKPKLELNTEKPLTIQQKVLAAITSNKNKTTFTNNQTNYHCTVSPFLSQKENKNPLIQDRLNKSDEDIKSSPLEKLQQFRKKNMALRLRDKFNSIFKKNTEKTPEKPTRNEPNEVANKNRILTPNFEDNIRNCHEESPMKSRIQLDSDDDFMSDRSPSPKKNVHKINTHRSTTNHKVRKVSTQYIHSLI